MARRGLVNRSCIASWSETAYNEAAFCVRTVVVSPRAGLLRLTFKEMVAPEAQLIGGALQRAVCCVSRFRLSWVSLFFGVVWSGSIIDDGRGGKHTYHDTM